MVMWPTRPLSISLQVSVNWRASPLVASILIRVGDVRNPEPTTNRQIRGREAEHFRHIPRGSTCPKLRFLAPKSIEGLGVCNQKPHVYRLLGPFGIWMLLAWSQSTCRRYEDAKNRKRSCRNPTTSLSTSICILHVVHYI